MEFLDSKTVFLKKSTKSKTLLNIKQKTQKYFGLIIFLCVLKEYDHFIAVQDIWINSSQDRMQNYSVIAAIQISELSLTQIPEQITQ